MILHLHCESFVCMGGQQPGEAAWDYYPQIRANLVIPRSLLKDSPKSKAYVRESLSESDFLLL